MKDDSQPSQNQAVIGSLSRLLEMFDHLLSKGLMASSCIQGSLSLLLWTNNLLFKIFLRRLIRTPILTTSLIRFRRLAECTFWTWEQKIMNSGLDWFVVVAFFCFSLIGQVWTYNCEQVELSVQCMWSVKVGGFVFWRRVVYVVSTSCKWIDSPLSTVGLTQCLYSALMCSSDDQVCQWRNFRLVSLWRVL